MRIALYSDLHLELRSDPWRPPALDVDVVVLAGDIGAGTKGIEWAAETFLRRSKAPAVLYIAGNHEYYGEELTQLESRMRVSAERRGIVYLEKDTLTVDQVRFLGTTLWSDFALYGSEMWTERSLSAAKGQISDFVRIRRSDRTIEPADTVALHRESVAWLTTQLVKPFSGKTVVISHFAPHRRCVALQYEGDVLTPYFVVDMAPLLQRHPIDVWMFGHTHHNVDFVIEQGCRIVSNQLGYVIEGLPESKTFQPDLVVEV